MTELERRDGVEDLHRQAESMRFWEEEPEQINLETCCLILSCSLERPIYRLSAVTTFGRKNTGGKSLFSISGTFAGYQTITSNTSLRHNNTLQQNYSMNSQTLSPNTASTKLQTTK